LVAVEPRLRGVVFAGAAGSGKSALARGLHALLPEQPCVELPLGADAEALLGGLDVEATLRSARRVVRPGLLARADGGILSVDAFNLLPESASNTLLAALETGAVAVERDGLSLRAAARFTLVSGFDPAEGPPRAHLLDRIGLIVTLPATGSAALRAEVTRRHLQPDWANWDEETASLRSLIALARASLAEVRIGIDQVQELVSAAIAFGVQGQRADSFAVMAARASAALGLRDCVERTDLETAVRLVILPRATRRPEAPPPEAPPQQDASPAAEPPPSESSGEPEDAAAQAAPEAVEELFQALAIELPDALDSLPFGSSRRGRAGSRGAVAAKRGRHVGSVPGELRNERVDVVATLRAAARWQRIRPRGTRRVEVRAEDFRVRHYRAKAGSLFLFAVDASGSMALHRMREAKGAVHALLEQAYVHRDQVALLGFRGTTAELLLPPTASVELVRRQVDLLRTGGGTPIAAALLASLEVAQRARRRGLSNVVLVLLTDGRANVGLRAERDAVEQELQQIAQQVDAARVLSLVIDTQRSYLAQGQAKKLAQWLGGQYLYLPGASGKAIAAAARASRCDRS
jgi:magnesium chelatase subunit D